MDDKAVTRASRDFYGRTFQAHAVSHGSLGYSGPQAQESRFEQFTRFADLTGSSVLDAGCGFADLYPFLAARFKDVRYTGIDIMPEFVAAARKRQPNAEILEMSIESLPKNRSWDFVFACGPFNLKQHTFEVVERGLRAMWQRANKAVAVSLLSRYSTSAENPEASYYEPADFVALAGKLSRRFSLNHGYRDNDFLLTIFKDQAHAGLEQNPGKITAATIRKP